MRVALALGWAPRMVRENMDAADLAEFEAWYEIEPWGCAPADQRAALIATCACNANPMRRTAARFEDLMPRRGPREGSGRQSEAAMMAILAPFFGVTNNG